MGCKGRARPLHARASGTSTRITCAFHEHGTCALHTARPGARTCSVFPQRIQLTGAYHHSGRESKDDAKPLHNRERQPLRESKNKNPRIFATYFRLGTPFRPRKAKIGSFMANYPHFHAPTRDLEPRNNPQSQKSCNSNRFFVFELPGRLPDDAMGRVAFPNDAIGRAAFLAAPWEAIQPQRHEAAWMQHREGRDGACSAPSGGQFGRNVLNNPDTVPRSDNVSRHSGRSRKGTSKTALACRLSA